MKILIISDIHANKYALEEVLTVIDFDFLVFLGDIVDYGPHPAECLDMIRENADIIVSGNHDYAVAFNVDCRCSEKMHDLSVYTRENITLKQLENDQIKWLQTLPIKKQFEIDGIRFFAVHASPRDPLYDYLLPDIPNEELYKRLIDAETKKIVDTDYVLIGHTHYQFKRRIGEINILNPGSVGQPRDGDPRAACMIFDTNLYSVFLVRFKYPIDKTISDIKKLKLPRDYEARLIKILRTGKI